MRLLIAIPSLAGGGAERIVATLVQHRPEACDARVLTFLDAPVAYNVDVPVDCLGMQTPKGPRGWLVYQARATNALARAKSKWRPDVVLSLMEHANFANLLTPRGERRVISINSTLSRDLRGLTRRTYAPIIRQLYPRAHARIVPTLGVATDLERHFGVSAATCHSIAGPVDLESIERGAHAPLPTPWEHFFRSRRVVLAVGRLGVEKGYGRLLRVFAQVHRGAPDSALVFVGSGPRKTELHRLAHELGLRVAERPGDDADVVFAGFQSNPYAFMARARVFALSSIWEGLGQVLIEALGCGTPIAASDCLSGPREILDPASDHRLRTNRVDPNLFGCLLPAFPSDLEAAHPKLDDAELTWAHGLAMLLSKDWNDLDRARARERAQQFSTTNLVPQWYSVISGRATLAATPET